MAAGETLRKTPLPPTQMVVVVVVVMVVVVAVMRCGIGMTWRMMVGVVIGRG